MKVILLLFIGATLFSLTGCESDVASPEEKPKVGFGNVGDHEDPYSRPTAPATDLERTPW